MPVLGSQLLTPLCLAAAVAQTAASPDEPVEAPRTGPGRPVLTILHPQENDSYVTRSSVAVQGRLSRPVYGNVDVRLYHEGPNKALIPQGGASVVLHGEDEFGCTVFPAATGWRAGRTVLEVELNQMRQVRTRREFTVVEPADGRPRTLPVHVDPPSAGLIADLDENPVQAAVPPGHRFLIEGTFEWTPPTVTRDVIQGPSCRAEIRDDRGVIMQSGGGLSFRDVGDRWWYEIELTAPREAGAYTLAVVEGGLPRPGQPRPKPKTLRLLVTEAIAAAR
ncbi:MAG TPA: hypothetical protein VF170_16080 [Planctomycetaceae bacterium]